MRNILTWSTPLFNNEWVSSSTEKNSVTKELLTLPILISKQIFSHEALMNFPKIYTRQKNNRGKIKSDLKFFLFQRNGVLKFFFFFLHLF